MTEAVRYFVAQTGLTHDAPPRGNFYFTVGLAREGSNEIVVAVAGGTKDKVLATLGDLEKVRRTLARWTRSTKKELREARAEVARLEEESEREREAARAFLALVKRKPEEVRS